MHHEYISQTCIRFQLGSLFGNAKCLGSPTLNSIKEMILLLRSIVLMSICLCWLNPNFCSLNLHFFFGQISISWVKSQPSGANLHFCLNLEFGGSRGRIKYVKSSFLRVLWVESRCFFSSNPPP